MRDLLAVYDAFDLMVGTGDGVTAPDNLIEARAAIDILRRRGAAAGATLVVALAGGTGTGKSSLLNAIAGEELASVSRLRPHTDSAMAYVPTDADTSVGVLLSELGVTELRRDSRIPGVALVDLPDMDSVAHEHRRLVERLIASVDAVLWVLDPEKYHDAILHDEFLRPLARHADQSAFVLNKIDRLGDEELSGVVASATSALVAGGYADPALFAVAARPAAGPPVAIGPLLAFLGHRLDRKRVAYGKLLTDIATAARTLGVSAGVWRGTGAGLAERWPATRESVLEALEAEGDAASDDALCRVQDLVAATAAELGGHLADGLRGLLGSEEVEDVLAVAQRAVAAGDVTSARIEMDGRIGDVMSDLVARRSRFAAMVALTHIGVRQVGHRYGVSVR